MYTNKCQLIHFHAKYSITDFMSTNSVCSCVRMIFFPKTVPVSKLSNLHAHRVILCYTHTLNWKFYCKVLSILFFASRGQKGVREVSKYWMPKNTTEQSPQTCETFNIQKRVRLYNIQLVSISKYNQTS